MKFLCLGALLSAVELLRPAVAAPQQNSLVTVTVSINTAVCSTSFLSTASFPSTTSVSSTATYAAPSGPESPCPASIDALYQSAPGRQYELFCGANFEYNDLPSYNISNFQDCIAACDAYVPAPKGDSYDLPCVGVTWILPEPNGANCFLKSAIEEVVYGVRGQDSAKLVTYNPPSVVVSIYGSPGVFSTTLGPTGTTFIGSSATGSSTVTISTISTGTISIGSSTVIAGSSTTSSISGSSSSATGAPNTFTGSSSTLTSLSSLPTGSSSTLTGSSSTSTGLSGLSSGLSRTSTSSSSIFTGSSSTSGSLSGTPTGSSSSTISSGTTSTATSANSQSSLSLSSSSSVTSGTVTVSSTTTTSGPSTSPCPLGNNTIFTNPLGVQYEILYGVNVQYYDLVSYPVATFDGCISSCDNYVPAPAGDSGDQPCVAITWKPIDANGNNCFLHYSATSFGSDLDQDSAIKLSNFTCRGSTITSSSSSTPATSPTSVISSTSSTNGTAVSSTASSSTVTSSTSAGSTTSTGSASSTISSSSLSSTSSTGSRSVTSSTGSASLTSSQTSTTSGSSIPASSSSTSTLTTTSTLTSSSSTSSSCPSLGPSVYQSTNTRFYQTLQDVSVNYQDLQALTAPTLDACITLCDNYVPAALGSSFDQPCVAVSWRSATQECYLHSSGFQSATNIGYDSAILLVGCTYSSSTGSSASSTTSSGTSGTLTVSSTSSSTVSTTSSSATSSTASFSTASSTSSTTSTSSSGTSTASSLTISSSTASSASSSSVSESSSTTTSSTASSSTASSSTASSSTASSTSTTSSIGSSTSTTSGPLSTSTCSSYQAANPCPAPDSSTYNSLSGVPYKVICNTEILYDDLTSLTVCTFDQCVSACDNYIPTAPGDTGDLPCVALSYEGDNISTGANCYLHYAVSGSNYTGLGLAVGAIQQSYLSTTTSSTSASSTTSSPTTTSTSTSSPTTSSSATSPPSSAQTGLPSSSGGTYQSPSGRQYTIEYGTSINYRDEPVQLIVDSFEDCIAQCDAYVPASPGDTGDQPCVGVTFLENTPTTDNCYLAYSTEFTGANAGHDAALLVQP